MTEPFWTLSPRNDGRTEWCCKHGVGHGMGIHGCDGCCSRADFPGKHVKAGDVLTDENGHKYTVLKKNEMNDWMWRDRK